MLSPSNDEVTVKIQQFKRNTSSGHDELPAELIEAEVWEMEGSTINHIFTLRSVLEKTQRNQVDTHNLFVDYKQTSAQ